MGVGGLMEEAEMDILVRLEKAEDRTAVYEVESAAFARTGEADLVDKLRPLDIDLFSFVAEVDGRVVGHVLFSEMWVVGETGRVPAMGLGPLAVLPEYQKQGIGTALTEAGLAACRDAGHEIVFVLGHPEYYPRFGFRVSRPLGIQCEFDGVPSEAFMVLALRPGALDGVTGVAHYHPLFAGV